MKKIGIITTSHAINYGAVLQAFALKKSLEDSGAHNVDIINYCGDLKLSGRCLYRENNSIKNIMYNIIVFFNKEYRLQRLSLIKKFDTFKNNKLKIKGRLLTSEDNLNKEIKYDVLVCGSDQIWNLNLFDDKNFFLMFGDKNNTKYYAYSASVAENMTDKQLEEIVNRTTHFNGISIREYDMADLLNRVISTDVFATIDPVFLLEKETWDVFSSMDRIVDYPYILVFMISTSKEDKKNVESIILEYNNIKSIVLNLHPFNYINGDITINTPSPEEFISLIKNAEAVITDSFHATAFSIIFNIDFYNIRRTSRNSRIENLYKIFDINSRYVDSQKYTIFDKMNYKLVNENIYKERAKSLKYIKNISC